MPHQSAFQWKALGDGNLFNCEVSIGHDCEIGSFNFFAPRSQSLGNVQIGNENQIGVGAVLLSNSTVGDYNKISPLSVVYKGCGKKGIYHGNPAVKVGVNNE